MEEPVDSQIVLLILAILLPHGKANLTERALALGPASSGDAITLKPKLLPEGC